MSVGCDVTCRLTFAARCREKHAGMRTLPKGGTESNVLDISLLDETSSFESLDQ